MVTGSLSRVRVLDLTRVLAGPWSTQMLGDLGADVIKVERPVLGDDTRHWGPPWVAAAAGTPTTDSAYFTSANRNKRSIAIDISTPDGQQLVKDLVRKCDILVENYKVGDLRRYGLSYADLKEVNPSLIYCSVTGYGQDGPYAERPGYDFIFQGEGGLMSITGEADGKPGGGPIKTSIAITDVLAGLNATIAILAALESRHHTGEGQHIDVALLDTVVHFGSNQIVSYFTSGEIPRRWGNAHPNLTPYQTFKTRDGHLIIACGNDSQFRKLCTTLGIDSVADDPRFARVAGRNVHRDALTSILSEIFGREDTAHWLRVLEHCEVPNGGINTYDKVFEHPQVVHRQLKVTQPHVHGGQVSTVRNPIRMSATPIDYRYAPPARAQHTVEILSSVLELSADEIERLRREQVIEVTDGKKGTAA
jgi:crotonobetainyl-CoA:carnitine CoA-transferase CaiB-like acyl-CoA transferase